MAEDYTYDAPKVYNTATLADQVHELADLVNELVDVIANLQARVTELEMLHGITHE